jgi:hypothetical protein
MAAIGAGALLRRAGFSAEVDLRLQSRQHAAAFLMNQIDILVAYNQALFRMSRR